MPKQTEFWPGYASVFLIVLALLYCVSAINPACSLADVGVAILGRVLGAGFYGAWCLTTSGMHGELLGLALINLLFALAYFRIVWESGPAQLRDAFRPPVGASTY